MTRRPLSFSLLAALAALALAGWWLVDAAQRVGGWLAGVVIP